MTKYRVRLNDKPSEYLLEDDEFMTWAVEHLPMEILLEKEERDGNVYWSNGTLNIHITEDLTFDIASFVYISAIGRSLPFGVEKSFVVEEVKTDD